MFSQKITTMVVQCAAILVAALKLGGHHARDVRRIH
jgi:hypothetical protein